MGTSIKLITKSKTYTLTDTDFELEVVSKMDGKPTEGVLTVFGIEWSVEDWVEELEVVDEYALVCHLQCTRNVFDPSKPSLTMNGTDSLKAWSDVRIALSFPNTTTPDEIASSVAKATGMRTVINKQSILPAIPKTYSCKWSDAMKAVFGKAWTVQNQTVYCGHNTTKVKVEEPHEVSPTTTELTQDGKLRTGTDVLIPLDQTIIIGSSVSGVVEGQVEAIKHRIAKSSRTTQLTVITERKHAV